VAQTPAVAPRPAALTPSPDHHATPSLPLVPLHQLANFHPPAPILLIPPARDVERRHGHAIQVRRERLLLPEPVVIRVRDEIIPRRQLPMEIFLVDVREGPEFQIPLEGVVPVELKA